MLNPMAVSDNRLSRIWDEGIRMKDETPFLPKPKTLTGAYVAFLYDIPANSHLYEF